MTFSPKNQISPRLLSGEFELTIALVVFVMLTAILLTLLIALVASKNFRRVFFRDKSEKSDDAPRPSDDREETVAAQSHPEYFEGILTVPIGAPPEKTAKAHEEPEIYDKIPTVAIPEVAIPEIDTKKSNAGKTFTVNAPQKPRAKSASSKTTAKTSAKSGNAKATVKKTSRTTAKSKTTVTKSTKKKR